MLTVSRGCFESEPNRKVEVGFISSREKKENVYAISDYSAPTWQPSTGALLTTAF